MRYICILYDVLVMPFVNLSVYIIKFTTHHHILIDYQ